MTVVKDNKREYYKKNLEHNFLKHSTVQYTHSLKQISNLHLSTFSNKSTEEKFRESYTQI